MISPESLKMLNGAMKWLVEPVEFRIMICASSKDIRLSEIITVVESGMINSVLNFE